MAAVATVISQQSIQFDVPAAAGAEATRVFVTTGIAQFAVFVSSTTLSSHAAAVTYGEGHPGNYLAGTIHCRPPLNCNSSIHSSPR